MCFCGCFEPVYARHHPVVGTFPIGVTSGSRVMPGSGWSFSNWFRPFYGHSVASRLSPVIVRGSVVSPVIVGNSCRRPVIVTDRRMPTFRPSFAPPACGNRGLGHHRVRVGSRV